MALMRRNAVYLTLPFAAVVGFIGYNVENLISDKYTPYSRKFWNYIFLVLYPMNNSLTSSVSMSSPFAPYHFDPNSAHPKSISHRLFKRPVAICC